jgi:hypothetical protein
VDQLKVDTCHLIKFFFSKKNLKYFFQKKKEKGHRLGVVSATPLAPWGWPSHPLVPKGVATATQLFLSFFFFEKNIFFKKIN